jgi:DNA repair ATPase RecN
MHVFIQCICEEDFKSLIISGKATHEQLQEAWVLLLSEYQELKGDTIETIEQVRLSRDIWKLRSHLQLLDICVSFLSYQYSESIAESLRQLGYNFKPQIKEPGAYINQLNTIINKSKLKYIQLQQMVKQLADELKKSQPEPPTREHFEETLIHIEEMQKTSYDLDHLTVYKYVMLEKKLKRQIESLQNRKQWQQSV